MQLNQVDYNGFYMLFYMMLNFRDVRFKHVYLLSSRLLYYLIIIALLSKSLHK